jgi:hypothetical protein
MATREDLEFTCLQLQNYGSCGSWFLVQSKSDGAPRKQSIISTDVATI